MMPNDYKVIDMPSMLARTATKPSSSDKTNWVRDESWYAQIRAIYTNLLKFFKVNGLIKNDIQYSSIDEVVVMFSDLNEDGQALVKSGADDRWLASFDRPGSNKPPSDLNSLERALSKIKGMAPPSG